MARTALDALIRPLQHRSPQTGLYLHNEAHSEAGIPFHSYPALYRMVCAAMHSCQTQGIVKGSRVIVPFATSIDSVVGFLALIGIGALPLSVKTAVAGGGREEYAQFLQLLTRRFGASAIIATAGLEQQATAQSAALPLLTISTELATTQPAPWAEPGLDDIAFVQFSSGTTAEPKGVPVRHDQLIHQLELILSQDARDASDVGASWLPLYHDMGLVGALLTSMHAGHSLHLDSPAGFLMNPVEWLHSLSKQRVTLSALPNFGMAYLLKRLTADEECGTDPLAGCRLDSLRRIYVGSDAIDAALASRFIQALAPAGLPADALTPCYGMAEAVLMVSCKVAGQPLSERRQRQPEVSVGTVLPDFEIRIVREDGSACAEGEDGQILLRGGTLASSYFEGPALTDAQGFYHSDDLGYLEAGQLYVSGRSGERVKINGQSFFLPHLENRLQTHPELRPGGAAVIQLDGQLVVLAEPKRVGLSTAKVATQWDGLRQQLSDLLLAQTGIKVPATAVQLVGRGQIWRTSSGKLQRNQLTLAYAQRELSLLEPAGTTTAPASIPD